MEQLGYSLIASTKQGTKIRGVAILAKKNLLVVKRKIEDAWGRWVLMECIINNEIFTIGSVYGSTEDDPEIFEFLDAELALWPEPIILCGDFNISGIGGLGIASRQRYIGRKKKVHQAIVDLACHNSLLDVWESLRPEEVGRKFYTAPHRVFARLDYFFASISLQLRMKIEKQSRIVSAHSPRILSLRVDRVGKSQNNWSFERALLSDVGYVEHMKTWIDTFWEINRSSAAPRIVWDTFKAGVRGETLSFSLYKQKQEATEAHRLIQEVMKAEEELQSAVEQGEEINTALLNIACTKSRAAERIAKAAANYLRKWQECHELSEKVGPILAVRTRQKIAAADIREIADGKGGKVVDTGKIREVFRQFYATL